MILDCTKKYLADGYPELVKEWSDKNEDYKPTDFTAGSSKKVWWKCHVCGYEWQSLISARSGGVKCLCSSGYVTVPGKNDLSITHPVLAGEWSDINEKGAKEYQSNSREYVWWKCSTCDYEWKAMIYNRVQGRCECPACKRAKQIERAVKKARHLIDMRKFEKHLREVSIMFYFDKAGYKLVENDISLIGVPIEFYCEELHAAFIISRPFHETIHGHRIENAKNDLCRKNSIRLIRILEVGCWTYDTCMCIQCDEESLESYDWAFISMFDALGISMNVDCERDMREMFMWYQKEIISKCRDGWQVKGL